MKSIGIDIGSSSIKIVELNQTNKGLFVTQNISHQIGLNPAFDTQIEIIEFLRSYLAQKDPSQIRFVCGLRQDFVSVRTKVFPFKERTKIFKSLPFELEEDLPFSSETAIFDAKIIKVMENGSAEILACATPKSRVAEFLDKLKDTGIDISILSSEGFALANCIENWNEAPAVVPGSKINLEEPERPKRKVSVYIHMGHNRTIVSAFENNRLLNLRCLLWGAKSIAESIGRKYELPFVEAVKEMQTKAFILTTKEKASYDQIIFSDIIANQVKELCQELKISILEFQSELNCEVEKVNISGGPSNIVNLNAFMTQQLEVPVNKVDMIRDPHLHNASQFNIAYGLAIEGLKKPRNPAIDFLKGEFARQNHVVKNFIDQWGFTLKVAAAAFVLFFVYTIVREEFASELVDTTSDALREQAKKTNQIPAKQINEAQIKKFIADKNKLAADAKMLTDFNKMNSALDILKKVNDNSPGRNAIRLEVKKFSVIDNRVSLEGTVGSTQELSVLQTALAQASENSKVENNPPSIRSASGRIPFSYSFVVDRGISTSNKKGTL